LAAQNLQSHKLDECLDKIDDMAIRASEIVRRVRAFVDHRAAQRSKHDINELICEVLKMLGSDLKAK
jgi:C4-dicarboxylate-specific signal transduction histidine kinase